MASAFKPTEEQLSQIIDLNSLLDYVGISGQPSQAAPIIPVTPQAEPASAEAAPAESAQRPESPPAETPPQQPQPPTMSPKQSLLVHLGLEPTQHFRVLAATGSDMFAAALNG